jgi:hypothetical protein
VKYRPCLPPAGRFLPVCVRRLATCSLSARESASIAWPIVASWTQLACGRPRSCRASCILRHIPFPIVGIAAPPRYLSSTPDCLIFSLIPICKSPFPTHRLTDECHPDASCHGVSQDKMSVSLPKHRAYSRGNLSHCFPGRMPGQEDAGGKRATPTAESLYGGVSDVAVWYVLYIHTYLMLVEFA